MDRTSHASARLAQQQQRERRAMQAALRAGTLPRWPAGLATFAGVAVAWDVHIAGFVIGVLLIGPLVRLFAPR